jgi:hypothetical protein
LIQRGGRELTEVEGQKWRGERANRVGGEGTLTNYTVLRMVKKTFETVNIIKLLGAGSSLFLHEAGNSI